MADIGNSSIGVFAVGRESKVPFFASPTMGVFGTGSSDFVSCESWVS